MDFKVYMLATVDMTGRIKGNSTGDTNTETGKLAELYHLIHEQIAGCVQEDAPYHTANMSRVA